MDMDNKFRFQFKKISDITTADDRVSFIGEVLERSQNRLVMGDESGEIEAIYSDIDIPSGKIFRISGNVNSPRHVVIHAITSLNGIDIELFHRAKKLFKY